MLGRKTTQSRFGVGPKLLFAFFAISFITITVSFTSWVLFSEINQLGTTIEAHSVPELAASEALGQSAETVLRALPGIHVRQSPDTLTALGQSIMRELDTIDQTANSIATRDDLAEHLSAVHAISNRLRHQTEVKLSLTKVHRHASQRRQMQLYETKETVTQLTDQIRQKIVDATYQLEMAHSGKANGAFASQLPIELRLFQQLMEAQFRLSASQDALMVIPISHSANALNAAQARLSLHLRVLTRIATELKRSPYDGLLDQALYQLVTAVSTTDGLFTQSTRLLAVDDRIALTGTEMSGDAKKLYAISRQLVSKAKANLNDSVAAAKQSITRSMSIILLLTITGVLVSIAIVWFYVFRNVVRRLNHLIQVMAGLAAGDLEVKVPNLGRDELGAVAKSLDRFKTYAAALQARETSLAESENRFNMAVKGSNTGIWDWNVETDTVYLSERAMDILNVPVPLRANGILSGDDVRNVVSKKEFENWRLALLAHLSDNKPIDFETRLSSVADKQHWICIRGDAVRNASGRALRVAGSIDDITGRKEIENALRRQTVELERSNAVLEQFAYIASHDLQEPLRMVSSYCELLEHSYAGRLDDEGRKFLTFAVQGSRRMRAMITDLLTFSRVGSQDLSPAEIDLNVILHHVADDLDGYCRECNGTIKISPLPKLLADASLLHHLFLNLVQNGLKYNAASEPFVHVHARTDGEHVVLIVEDNGIGIPAPYREQIFEIFKRLHGQSEYPGTGVGLAITKRIVERLDGTIWVEDSDLNGTRFCIKVPPGAVLAFEDSAAAA